MSEADTVYEEQYRELREQHDRVVEGYKATLAQLSNLTGAILACEAMTPIRKEVEGVAAMLMLARLAVHTVFEDDALPPGITDEDKAALRHVFDLDGDDDPHAGAMIAVFGHDELRKEFVEWVKRDEEYNWTRMGSVDA